MSAGQSVPWPAAVMTTNKTLQLIRPSSRVDRHWPLHLTGRCNETSETSINYFKQHPHPLRSSPQHLPVLNVHHNYRPALRLRPTPICIADPPTRLSRAAHFPRQPGDVADYCYRGEATLRGEALYSRCGNTLFSFVCAIRALGWLPVGACVWKRAGRRRGLWLLLESCLRVSGMPLGRSEAVWPRTAMTGFAVHVVQVPVPMAVSSGILEVVGLLVL
ncbi:hypothetical protein BKA80DRAFT_282284 [Phyllosticta citrichinensis]